MAEQRRRQQLLFLHLANPDLAASTIGWALYDGAAPKTARQMQSGDQSEPPLTPTQRA